MIIYIACDVTDDVRESLARFKSMIRNCEIVEKSSGIEWDEVLERIANSTGKLICLLGFKLPVSIIFLNHSLLRINRLYRQSVDDVSELIKEYDLWFENYIDPLVLLSVIARYY